MKTKQGVKSFTGYTRAAQCVGREGIVMEFLWQRAVKTQKLGRQAHEDGRELERQKTKTQVGDVEACAER